jgi:hypothetical protein
MTEIVLSVLSRGKEGLVRQYAASLTEGAMVFYSGKWVQRV